MSQAMKTLFDLHAEQATCRKFEGSESAIKITMKRSRAEICMQVNQQQHSLRQSITEHQETNQF